MEKFNEEIEVKALKNEVFLSGCSHVGGDKYAGNLIIYSVAQNGKVLATGMVMLLQMMCLSCLSSISRKARSLKGFGGVKWVFLLSRKLRRESNRHSLMETV